MERETRDGAGTADGAEQATRRGYLVSDHKAKQVDDLRKYYPEMVRRARIYVPAQDAEHVANAAFCDAHAPSRDRPEASEVPRIKCWLDALVYYRAKAYWKERGKCADEILCENFDDLVEAHAVDVEGQIEDRECIQMMLDSLPQERRDVFLAYAVEGVPVEDVAEEYGVKKNTVYSWVHLARNEMRAKWNELCGDAWKRFGMLFPFLLLRRCWQQWRASTRDASAREARPAGAGIAGAPMPWVLGVAACVLALGFAPSSPSVESNDPVEVSTRATNREDAVVLAYRHSEFTGSTGSSRASSDTAVVVPVPKKLERAPSTAQPSKRSATNDESNGTLDEALLIRARAAYNKGNHAKAKALLDEHEATFPRSSFADLRNALREITVSAMVPDRR